MHRAAFLICLLVLVVAAAPAQAHYRPIGKLCKPVAFTPQTDEGASAIRAKKVKCRTARRMVRAYHNGDVTPRDFSCRSRPHDPRAGLAHRDVVCRRGERRVSWAAT